MKNKILLGVIFISFIACNNNQNTQNISDNIGKVDSTSSNFILKDKIKDLQFVVNYNSSTEITIDDENYRNFFAWLIDIKENPIFQKLYLTPSKNCIVIKIESITNKEISSNSAKKRIDDIVSIIDLTLGTDAEDLPIFKTLGYLKYGNKTDNYVKVSFNQLLD